LQAERDDLAVQLFQIVRARIPQRVSVLLTNVVAGRLAINALHKPIAGPAVKHPRRTAAERARQ